MPTEEAFWERMLSFWKNGEGEAETWEKADGIMRGRGISF
jgi:hypothetical protein